MELSALRLFAQYASDVMIQVGPDGRILDVSASVQRYGYTPEELIGQPQADLFPPDTPTLTETTGRRRLRTRSGDWAWVEGVSRPGLEGPGEHQSVFTVLRDVTDQHRLGDEGREGQDLFEPAFEYSAIGKVLLDMTGRIIRVNRAICDALGYTAEELVGLQDNDVAHPDEIDKFTDLYRSVIGGDVQSYQVERRYRRRDGTWVWFSLIVSMARNSDGSPKAIVAELQDLTERHATDAELRRKRAEAEAATIAKTEFLANMSHELRTPLTGIIGFGGLLQGMAGLPERARTYVGGVVDGGEALLAIVNNILDFTKLEAGHVALDPQPLDPRALVDEVNHMIQVEADRKQLALRTQFSAALPGVVTADSARIRQVLLNLLSNAVKFTQEGEVCVAVSYDAGHLEFRVTDTGIGIPDALSHRLFQRFSQVDGSISRTYGGTGLGLAISKGLVEMMGGEIGMESREGVGSSFWFTVAAPVP